ncbi:hypothetical protein NUW58_g2247 [Xylaria curta]|uniref:Uncharacterized protein n=1 Tax=Xylaria curta TaxID=42375 RepID=A0ACC1PJ72_9PEZI|nr:hypothetical protein NUW58_g2247 [Xylaria curta]
MTSVPSSSSPAGTEAGRHFQLPPRTEKRTQASTMFSTTAKNLTSNVPFRWRPDQVRIFEDWIRFKGPNVMSADLVPLLRALDLDGYEDVRNERGECVHDLIIVKVRRKLTRTKSEMKNELEGRPKADIGGQRMRATPERVELRSTGIANMGLPDVNFLKRTEESGRDETITNTTTNTTENDFGGFRLDPRVLQYNENSSDYRSQANIPSTIVRGPWRLDYQHLPRLSLPKQGDNIGAHTAMPVPASTPMDAPKRMGQRQPMQTATSRSELRFKDVATRGLSNSSLLVCMDKLKAVMREFATIIDQLPESTTAAALGTAAYDAELDIEHLESLVGEYLED